jgi:hypothetical protein
MDTKGLKNALFEWIPRFLIVEFQHTLNILGAREANFALHRRGTLRSIHRISEDRDFNGGFASTPDLSTLI